MTLRRRGLLAAAALAPAASFAAPARLGDGTGVSAAPLYEAGFVDLDGRNARLAAGRPTLVNFWARWCGPCKVEIPELVALHTRRTGVDVVGIAVENDPASVRDFARAYEMDYTLLLAPGAAGLDLLRRLGNPGAGLPYTLALDRRGEIAALHLGVLTRALLEAAAQRALR